jgi:acetyltransferase (GNAT) family protein
VGPVAASIVPPEGEHLVDGWEPDLPAGDTLVRQAVHVHASWSVAVARSAGRPWRAGPGWAGGWIGDRGALTNPIVLLRPPADPPVVLQEIDSLFPAHVPYLLVSAFPLPQLRKHGLALLGHPPLMVRLPGSAPDAAAREPRAPSVQVRPVRDAQELALAERVLVDGYPMPDLEPLGVGDLLGPSILTGPTRVWLAWLDDRPVAVSAAHQSAGVTLIEYVATLPDARGLGAGSAVTWAATLSAPDQPAVLLASDDGRPVYERMGYRAIERWSAWLRPGR